MLTGSLPRALWDQATGAGGQKPELAAFEILDHKIVAMLIDGSKAAVQWHAKMRSTITGETVETDLFDLIEMEDGRIRSFYEFCDTALAARMMRP